MSGVTDNFGLILPAAGEPYDVEVTNGNNKEIDKYLGRYSGVNSTLDTGATTCTQSHFTRIRFDADTGIIIAHIVCVFDVPVTMPANDAAGVLIGTLVPVGYRPLSGIGMTPSTLSGAGQGGAFQMAVAATGALTMRSNSTGFNTVAGTQGELNISWRWDGNLT